jgi:hypothetical protein
MAYEDQEEQLMTFDDIDPKLSAEMRAKRGDDLPEDLASVEEVELDLDTEQQDADVTTDAADAGQQSAAGDDTAGQAAGDAAAAAGEAAAGEAAEDRHGKVENIPYPRFKEINDELKRTREQLEQAQQQLAQQVKPAEPAQDTAAAAEPEFDLPAKIKERNAAVYDGDLELADRLDLEIESHRQQKANKAALAAIEQREQEARARTEQAEQEKRKELILKTSNEVWDRRVSNFNADKELITQFDEMTSFLAREKGYDPVKAILRAEELLFGKVTTPPVTPEVTDRQRQAIERNVDAAARQPSSLAATGAGSRNDQRTPRTALEMDDKEYESLPDKQKKIDRGDVLA